VDLRAAAEQHVVGGLPALIKRACARLVPSRRAALMSALGGSEAASGMQ
jgi:hypothetical protein